LITVAPYAHGRLSQRASVDVVGRGGDLQRVVVPAGSPAPYRALWSPDDSMVAWAARDGLHVENADGSAPRLLVAGSTSCTGACTPLGFVWSPDSRSLTVGGAGPQTNELLLVPLDGSAPQLLAPTLPFTSYNPSFWTPDGGSLVFGSFSGDIGTSSCCHADIGVTTPATGKTRTLYTTRNWHGVALPLPSPDLRYRAVITERSQYRQELRIVDTATGKSRLVKGVNPTNFAAWSPDSHTVAVVESSRHVVTVSASSGRVREIGRGLDVSWSRDGELLVVRGTYDQIWASSGGRPELLLFESPQGRYIESIDGD
jgi:Tol biopolymer transport system component